MATDPFEPRQDRRGSILDTRETSVAAPGFDPSLDPTIRRLFEQQAEIQAKLAALLPARRMPNGQLELAMLRHKLHALETYVRSQSMYSFASSYFFSHYIDDVSSHRSFTDCVVLTKYRFAKICLAIFLFSVKSKKPGHYSTDANVSRAT